MIPMSLYVKTNREFQPVVVDPECMGISMPSSVDKNKTPEYVTNILLMPYGSDMVI